MLIVDLIGKKSRNVILTENDGVVKIMIESRN